MTRPRLRERGAQQGGESHHVEQIAVHGRPDGETTGLRHDLEPVHSCWNSAKAGRRSRTAHAQPMAAAGEASDLAPVAVPSDSTRIVALMRVRILAGDTETTKARASASHANS